MERPSGPVQRAAVCGGSTGESFRPACKKCGYPGHFTYQCRNLIQLNAAQNPLLDISSTSSESSDDETPLKLINQAELQQRLQQKPVKKESKKRKRDKHKSGKAKHDQQSDQNKRKKEKRKKHKHRAADGSSSDSDACTDSLKKRNKHKKRHRRSSSSQ